MCMGLRIIVKYNKMKLLLVGYLFVSVVLQSSCMPDTAQVEKNNSVGEHETIKITGTVIEHNIISRGTFFDQSYSELMLNNGLWYSFKEHGVLTKVLTGYEVELVVPKNWKAQRKSDKTPVLSYEITKRR